MAARSSATAALIASTSPPDFFKSTTFAAAVSIAVWRDAKSDIALETNGGNGGEGEMRGLADNFVNGICEKISSQIGGQERGRGDSLKEV